MPRFRSPCAMPFALVLALAAPFAAAQEAPPAELKAVAKTTLRYVVQVPPGYAPEQWVPMLVVFGDKGEGEGAARAAIARVGAAGFVVVAPVLAQQKGVADLRPLFAELRRTYRVDQGGMHALLCAPNDIAVLLAHRHQFQTVSWTEALADNDVDALKRLPARRVGLAPSGRMAEYFTDLHRQRSLPGAAGEVARALDDFHDAAANADEARYFAILPDDGVFLGTDGTERWTGAQFKRDYMKYFQRDTAWTYVTLRREVDVEPGDAIAWFDESFDNEAYGECRGSGVMAKRDGKWVLRQYHLTIPVPNDVARDVAARIRSFQDGVAPRAPTIVLVRHAEKADEGDDPQLSAAGEQRAAALARTLRDVPIDSIYMTQFRRTVATVTPIAAPRKIEAVPVPATDVAALVELLRGVTDGQTVLVCGHSNTLPKILKALGVAGTVTIDEDEFDRLFVVTLEPGAPRMLSLRYGP